MNLLAHNFFPDSVCTYIRPGKSSVATNKVAKGRCGVSFMPSCLVWRNMLLATKIKPKDATWCMLTALNIEVRYSGVNECLCDAIAPKTIDKAMFTQPK